MRPTPLWLCTLSALALSASGCENNLPVTSFVDKLRVLAVKAEPPEVAPGATSALSVLAVEPEQPQVPLSPLTAVWLACRVPPGVAQPLPCGLEPGQLDKGALPPPCGAELDGTLCLLGESLTATARPGAALLGSSGTGTLRLAVAIADSPGGAAACLLSTAQNGALPTEPDRCVIAEKRLVVSDPFRPGTAEAPVGPPNQNPSLERLDLVDEDGTVRSLLADDAQIPPSSEDAATEHGLRVLRQEGSSERKADGSYEAMSLSWFTSGGRINGGRSVFDPPGCDSQAACASVAPVTTASTIYVSPTAAVAATQTDPRGRHRAWAVLRDDRGGVGWLEGSITLR